MIDFPIYGTKSVIWYIYNIPFLGQDLDNLESIWELTQEWQMAWDSWKVGTFASLKTDDMGYQAQVMLKKLNKLAREVKVRHMLS